MTKAAIFYVLFFFTSGQTNRSSEIIPKAIKDISEGSRKKVESWNGLETLKHTVVLAVKHIIEKITMWQLLQL